MNRDENLAWAYLSRVVEPPCVELAELVERVGPVTAAELIRRGAAGDELARRTSARRDIDCAEADLDTLARLGGRLVTPDCEEWPWLSFQAFVNEGARSTPGAHAPLVLWALGSGHLDGIASRGCAIVGTRASTTYGERVAADLASGLVERDFAVVSGAAYGIDGAAHRATLAADGVTVAVLACGMDVPYPAGHAGLLRRMADRGLVLSEYPPGVRPARQRFLTRNRLVAALGGATVIVEAGLRSGAANTAGWARTLGRPVCAVPGPVTSSASAGCHELLRRGGARLVTRAAEVAEVAGRMGEFADEPAHPVSPLDALAPEELTVYDALPTRGSRTVDEVAVASGLPPSAVLGRLATLELAGLVARADGLWKIAR